MKVDYFEGGYLRRYTAKEAEALLPITQSIFGKPDGMVPHFTDYSMGSKLFARPDWNRLAFAAPLWHAPSKIEPDQWPRGATLEFMEGLFQYQTRDERGNRLWSPLRPLWATVVENEVDELLHMRNPFSAADGAVATPVISTSMSAMLCEETHRYGGVTFTRKGDWAAFCVDWQQTILAGTPSFISRVAEKAGGEHFLKQLLDEFFEDLEKSQDNEELSHARDVYLAVGWGLPTFLRV